MRGLLQAVAAMLLAPALANAADQLTALVTLNVPATGGQEAGELTLKFDLDASSESCSRSGIRIDGHELSHDAKDEQSYNRGALSLANGSAVEAHWAFECLESDASPKQLALSFQIDTLDGQRLHDVGFIAAIRRSFPFTITGLDSAESFKYQFFLPAPEPPVHPDSTAVAEWHRILNEHFQPEADEAVDDAPDNGEMPDPEDELAAKVQELELLRTQARELHNLIKDKEAVIFEQLHHNSNPSHRMHLPPPLLSRFRECHSLKCVVAVFADKIKHTTGHFCKGFFGPEGGRHPHGRRPAHPDKHERPEGCPPCHGPPGHHGPHHGLPPHGPPGSGPPGYGPPHHGPPHHGPPPHGPPGRGPPGHGPPGSKPSPGPDDEENDLLPPPPPGPPVHLPHDGKHPPPDFGLDGKVNEKDNFNVDSFPGSKEKEQPMIALENNGLPPPPPDHHGEHGPDSSSGPQGPHGHPPHPFNRFVAPAGLAAVALFLFFVGYCRRNATHLTPEARRAIRRAIRQARDEERARKMSRPPSAFGAFVRRIKAWCLGIDGEKDVTFEERTRSLSEDSISMEQEIAQFRRAASVVEGLVAAEEGRMARREAASGAAPPFRPIAQQQQQPPAVPRDAACATCPGCAAVDEPLPSYVEDSHAAIIVADGCRYTPGSSDYAPSITSSNADDVLGDSKN